jgi:hypothetical protein
VIDNSHFRELLRYVGQDNITDIDIPGWTYLAESIMKAWKEEQEEFHQEMKVRQILRSRFPPALIV